LEITPLPMKNILAAALLASSPIYAAITGYGTPQSAYISAPSITVNVPNGGTTVGADTLVLLQVYDHSGTPGFVTPAGFTLATQVSAGSGVDEMDVYYRNYTSGSSLPSSITITSLDAGTPQIGAICFAYQGHNPASPLDGTPTQSSQTTPAVNSYAGPSITTTQANDTVVWNWAVFGDIGTGATSVSQGSKIGEVTRAQSGATLYMAIASNTITSPGASGTNTLTWGNTQGTVLAATLAIKPASAQTASGASISAGVSISSGVTIQ
jgi:hypothetical protein